MFTFLAYDKLVFIHVLTEICYQQYGVLGGLRTGGGVSSCERVQMVSTMWAGMICIL